MIVALSGTPGTGKSTVAGELEGLGLKVRSLYHILEAGGLLTDFDESCGSHEVNPEEASELIAPLLDEGGTTIIEGHLSHLLPCDMIVVLRCSPGLIRERLEARGYGEAKVLENMEAEALDIIAVEALETGKDSCELDCTSLSPAEAAREVLRMIEGAWVENPPGRADWSEELIRWC